MMNASSLKSDRSGRAMRRLLAVALALTAAPSFAAEGDVDYNTFEFTPFVGHMFGGEFEDPVTMTDRDLDADTNFGLIFDIAADQWRHYEFLYSTQSTQLDGVTTLDMDVQYLQIGGTVSHPEAERVIPYFGLTVGAARFSPDETGLDDETKLAFSVGGGVKVPITDHIGVRFDARAFISLLDTDGEIFCVSDAGATCRIRAKSDTFVQYAAALGVVIGF
jgi:opacity protein-like surface antigen